MTLGKRISSLRNQHKMSQEDLAEKINVSRQSISKWETDTSVPELDKLMLLSEVFHITLDELVKGETPTEDGANMGGESKSETPSQAVQSVDQKSTHTQKVVGTILLCFGLLVLLLLTLLGGFLSGLLFSSPFILFGTIFLVFKRNVGLWCGWALLFVVNVYLRYATGISWPLVRLTLIYEPSMNYLRLAFAWIELISYAVFIIVTVMRFRKKPLMPTRKVMLLLVSGCIALALTYIPITLDTTGSFSALARLYFIFSDWFRLALLTSVLTTAVRLFCGSKQ